MPESKADGLVLDKLPPGRDLTVRTKFQPTDAHLIIFVILFFNW